MALVFFPAGKMCKKIMDNLKIIPDYIIDNTLTGTINKVPIYNKEKLSELTENDVIYIVSYKYQKEIFDEIISKNPLVKIQKYADWLMTYAKKYLTNKEFYESADEKAIDQWITSALNAEVPFWDNMMGKNKGDVRFYEREFSYPNDTTLAFHENDIILDVGSGPLPIFGNLLFGGGKINYIPIDPLSFQYALSREKYGYSVPVSPRFGIIEDLSSSFMENSIDYIIIQNAMDHCIDIVRGFLECFKVLKINGCLLLSHLELECLWGAFDGLHQWGFTVDNDDLIIIGYRNMKVNISRLFKKFCEIKIKADTEYRDGQRWINVTMKKIKNIPRKLINKYDSNIFRGILVRKLFERLSTCVM